ncbi:MAG TPA: FAD-dependent monooxygenase [Steroidobacteraceae bacterium]|nr:FAD-dependent monooxygenase [Steroidobacteraceae bacterium]
MALNVAIVGGGIGGLTAALALLRSGHCVRVYEQARMLREAGAGLTLTPNATRVLQHLGLGPTLEQIGNVPYRGAVLHWRTGEELVENTRASQLAARYGAPYCQVHRADLQRALSDAVIAIDRSALRVDSRLIGVDQHDERVIARFENGATAAADVLIGADGLKSSVRRLLFGSGEPRFTGQVAWRGLVPAPQLACAALEPPSAMSIGPGRIFTRYLLRGGALVNYVAIVCSDAWQEESWSTLGDRHELLDLYAGWSSSVRSLIDRTPTDGLFKWALFDRPSLPTWRSSRCTLLGDAAHPMLPFLGQGAAMAIEDACILARALCDNEDVARGLATYERARIPRTSWVAEASRAAGARFQSTQTESYTASSHVSAISLDLPAYDAVSVPL